MLINSTFIGCRAFVKEKFIGTVVSEEPSYRIAGKIILTIETINKTLTTIAWHDRQILNGDNWTLKTTSESNDRK